MTTKKTEEPKTKTTTETKILKCELTQAEVLVAADELARALDELHSAQSETESLKRQMKAKEAALEARITEKQLLVRNKYDFRKVECRNVLDFNTLEAYTLRLDTNEEIERRPLTMDEKQGSLPFDSKE